uniref:Ig-like domain-containing protein n=1 Tax=Sinocyclocheilus anshuiensis TaxID=1608454 RepID=A0A671NGW5_9TELE
RLYVLSFLSFYNSAAYVFSENGWGVSYSHSHICALKNSSVIMSLFWTRNPVKDKEPPDLSKDPEYSQRLQYLGDKQQNCTIRLSHVTQKDEHKYCFRFITDQPDGKWLGYPEVTLTVTALDIMCVLCSDLQVEAPERVTEGHNVSLTCKSSCTLTDRATFIWYRNSQPLTERRDGNNQLLLQSVRREDAGRYNCALHGHSYISPAAHLSVTYPPKNVLVSITGSAEIVEGDSVILSCSSDSNPPALNFSWFKENQSSAVGSGQSFSALQSGRFYCEAHNQHGSQRSDAVTVIVKGAAHIYITLSEVNLFRCFTLLSLLTHTRSGFSTLALEVHFPAEFHSNPNQTHLNKLIELCRITRKVLAVGLVKVKLELNSAGKWISKARVENPCTR